MMSKRPLSLHISITFAVLGNRDVITRKRQHRHQQIAKEGTVFDKQYVAAVFLAECFFRFHVEPVRIAPRR